MARTLATDLRMLNRNLNCIEMRVQALRQNGTHNPGRSMIEIARMTSHLRDFTTYLEALAVLFDKQLKSKPAKKAKKEGK